MRNLHIIFTSDTHGHVLPVNYGKRQRENGGLLCLAGRIHELGEKPDFEGQRPENTLVIDGGDSLQGTPLTTYYIANRDSYDHHPVADGFNAMGLDFFTLGNHDFNFGYEALQDYLGAMKGQCICANVNDLKGELGIRPYLIHTMPDGIRVGITAAVTDWVNVWEQEQNLTYLQVTEPIPALKKALEEMKGQCDLTIGIYHGGFERDLTTGQVLSDTTENLACRIMQDLEFDLLLTGHQHMAVASYDQDGTHACQPMDKCASYCAVQALVSEDGKVSFTSKIVPVTEYPEDPEAAFKVQDVEADAQKWLDQVMGHLETEIPPENKLEAAMHGSALASLFNAVQLERTDADFSCSALMNDPLGFKSQITMRDITAAYQFSNTIRVLEVTVETIRESLERAASYFDLVDGRPVISDRFLQPKVEHYNYDYWANLDYAFDLRKPLGQRVVKMQHMDGTPLSADRTYTLVTSDYRATGTGGYPAIGNSPVILSTTDEMPDLIADYIRRHSPVPEIVNSKMEVIY